MADVHSKETRSYNMSMIRSKNTKPEMLIRSYLHRQGYRFRLHDKKLPGKPDIVLPKYKTVIFVHGCFWHGHKGCKYFVVPKTRTKWWLEKINGNIARDRKVTNDLRKMGWRVISYWECSINKMKNKLILMKRIHKYLQET
ncbi:MAG: DNA mismatch endonuclease Vsr [Ignavibacteriae bacterium]|nr:MAG: DNA mismatch endonuclease Vsr [Ignavibacteriota bacterium]